MNEKDIAILNFCKTPQTIKQISSNLKIAVKNVWVKIRILEKNDLLVISKNKIIKKTLVRTKQNKEFITELKRLLNILAQNKGSMSQKDFYEKAWEKIDFVSNKGYLLNQVIIHLTFSDLIQKEFSITKEGKEELKRTYKFSKSPN